MEKCVVIGLDGFEPTLLERWRQDLPTLNSLIERGVYSKLKSTTPMGSPPAWTSFATGKNPWNHGICGLRHEDGTFVSAREIEGPRVWNYLNEAGFKTGVVNLAVTFPPEKIDGFMTSSLMTPPRSKSFTYPVDLEEKLPHKRPEFEKVGRVDEEEGVARALDTVYETTDKAKENILWLIENKDWDFFSFNLRGPDYIAHNCWHLIDEGHPCYNEDLADKFGNVVFNYYKHVDEVVGEILEESPDRSVSFLVSDHGTGSVHDSEGPAKYAKTELMKLFFKGGWKERKDILQQIIGKINLGSSGSASNKEGVITGEHRFYGIFIAHGESIKKRGGVESPGIVDMAPTILHMFGLPVPKDMDGRVLEEIFDPGHEVAEREIKYRDPGEFRKEFVEKEISESAEEKVRERLKDLGYL